MTTSLTFSPTRCDRGLLKGLIDAVPVCWKGSPLDRPWSLRDFAVSGIDALGGELPLPLLLLRESALSHNIAKMARFAAEQDVLLAPHSKTTMSPELIARQIEAGCWAVTAATPSQVQTLRRLGVQRILIANELAERAQIRWLAAELERDPDLELLCLVDSTAGVALLDRELQAAHAPRPVNVLLEVGVRDGRAGVRTLAAARAVAADAQAAPALDLVGVECFEGLAMDPSRIAETIAEVDEQLAAVHEIAEQLHRDGLLCSRLVSAGGSAFFDRVLARFPRPEWQVALRSGCYVSQDGGFYEQASPLAGRGADSSPLRDALELWGVVLSSPQPGVVVVGAGKRDAPFDVSPPRPVAWHSADGTRGGELVDAKVVRLNDQHATIVLAADRGAGGRAHGSDAGESGPSVGNLVRFAISHPCGAFDRWRVIPLVDDDHVVIGAAHTAF